MDELSSSRFQWTSYFVLDKQGQPTSQVVRSSEGQLMSCSQEKTTKLETKVQWGRE